MNKCADIDKKVIGWDRNVSNIQEVEKEFLLEGHHSISNDADMAWNPEEDNVKIMII